MLRETQLFENVKEVVLHRVIARMELLCGVVVAQAFGDKPHHRFLSFAQQIGAFGINEPDGGHLRHSIDHTIRWCTGRRRRVQERSLIPSRIVRTPAAQLTSTL